MARVRHSPVARRKVFWSDVRRSLWVGVLVTAVAVAAANWPAEWTEPDEETRDQITQIALTLLLLLLAWFVLRAIVNLARWRRAVRWERMLGDPDRAHLVPPLESHAKSVRSPAGPFALLAGTVVVGLGAIGALAYGVLGADGRNDAPNTFLVGGLLSALTVVLFRRYRKARVARRVEKLSNDAKLVAAPRSEGAWAPPVPGGAFVATVPPLEFAYLRSTEWVGRVRQRFGWRDEAEPPSVLYLRLFDNEGGTERFLDGSWRRVAYVHVLRSASQVTADELEAAEDTENLASMFVASAEQMDDALRRQRTGRIDRARPTKGLVAKWRWAADSERGTFPVRALLCHGTFWRSAVDLLLERMDFVFIDLTGFVPSHEGTAWELQRVIDRFPIDRVWLLAGPASDDQFLTAQVAAMWRRMAPDSPNAGQGLQVIDIVDA